jgi:superfamily II DNA or RNA helicase
MMEKNKNIAMARQIQRKSVIHWEKGFANSMEKCFEAGWDLSLKQRIHWRKLQKKYFPEVMKKEVQTKLDFSPIVFLNKEKEKIQREAYQEWAEADFAGSLEIATGVGKTLIGLMAIQRELDAKWWIIVPKIDLQKQWIEEIKTHLKIGDNMIGRVGNGYNEHDKPIVVAIINSVRDRYLEGNLIMDEAHRYGSEENIRFLQAGKFKKILALTATSYRQDGMHKELFNYAPLIFSFNQKEAINKNILSKFELINMKISLTNEEEFKYRNMENFIEQHFPTFDNDFNSVSSSIRLEGEYGSIACDLMRTFTQRRNLLLNAESRITETLKIITENQKSKILVFCEYIKTADKIAEVLKMLNIPSVKYHSGMKDDEKSELLEKFRNNEMRIMVTVKSLDEGTNIPDCDMAIITAGTSVKRQMVQRLGRILRKSENKEIAKVYHLYIPNSQDEKWMKSRLNELAKNANNVINI